MRNNRRNKRHFNLNTKITENKVVRSLIFIVVFFSIILLLLFIFTKLTNHIFLNNLAKKTNDIIYSDYNEQNIDRDKNETKSNKISKTSFTLTAIGDIMCHNTQYWDAYNKSKDEYDFSYVFDDVKNYTLSSDITIGNLETSFAGKERGYSNYPTFNSPDSLAKCIADIGVDVISTAGNHCLDMGFSGLSRTIDVLDSYNISHLGTYKTEESQKELLYNDINGVKIAFLDYTYGTNGIPIPSGKDFCVNLINKSLIKSQIEKAKSENADIIVACMHWGTEYEFTPNKYQEDMAKFLSDNGVDIIIGTHPHVIQPITYINNTLVIYSLGNFISAHEVVNTANRVGLMVSLDIEKDSTTSKISINNLESELLYTYYTSNYTDFKVIPFSMIDSNYLSNYKEVYTKYRDIVKSIDNNIKVKELNNAS